MKRRMFKPAQAVGMEGFGLCGEFHRENNQKNASEG